MYFKNTIVNYEGIITKMGLKRTSIHLMVQICWHFNKNGGDSAAFGVTSLLAAVVSVHLKHTTQEALVLITDLHFFVHLGILYIKNTFLGIKV